MCIAASVRGEAPPASGPRTNARADTAARLAVATANGLVTYIRAAAGEAPRTPASPESVDPVLFARLSPETQQALYNDLTRLGLDTSRLVLPPSPPVAASSRRGNTRVVLGQALTAEEATSLDRAMGIAAAANSGPTMNASGRRLVMGTETPTQARARIAAGKGRAA